MNQAPLFTLTLLVAVPALAGPLHYLARNELLCEPSKETCVRGTLTYEQNDHLLRLRGRVVTATGPGVFQITLSGATRQSFRHYTPMEISIRGRPTEIVDYKMIPDQPDVHDWVIDRIEFMSEQPH